MTREDYNSWKHEGVTKVVLQFLKDKQEYMKQASLERWLDTSELSETVRGQIIELQEMIDLPFEAIQAFYKEKNGTESESPGGSPG